ncbi:Pyruvate-formate lyase-activating enzyme [Candidatus Electrothrix marina]|uniref:Pyruvate-formate lyase-activating enzyme n=1 Tax=Candidatus Electrothrix marina TaxID=1859130 RepID=A0A444JGQ5_9BACT|nr:Pyruvate-formate lyase-activating enzyme [Candidatus Electrothrix marina]
MSSSKPALVFANSKGEIRDYEGLTMAGASGELFHCPDHAELIELPEGSELFVLPGRLPVGIEPDTGEPALLDADPYTGETDISAVAAFMAPAHTAVYTAAYQSQEKAPLLPLFAYTAVGWMDGKFWVAAFRSDQDNRQDIAGFNQNLINKRTEKKLRQHRDNRLIQHLGKCCLTYGCPAARNYFLGRWEAPLPSSPACNASCVGCISLQPSGCCPSTQDRIRFAPTAREIAEIAIPHLKNAPRPVVSFGQGCEGEPLLQASTLEKSIHMIRRQTTKGTINLNTNASLPDAVEKLAAAGLDSIRVSMNSARPDFHQRYYRPSGFSFKDVRRSIEVMKAAGKHVSLNYFILPGFTDDPEEYAAFCELIASTGPDLIQLRNLNMDPEQYRKAVRHAPTKPPLGMLHWLHSLKEQFPALKFGYFNPCLD